MILTLRARGVGRKFTLISSALVLAISALFAAVPFMSGLNAYAAPDTTYQAIGFDGLTWGPDRTTPTGGYTITGDQLIMNVDSDVVLGSFYHYEGLKAELPAGTTSVKADLYVDPAWEDLDEPIIVGMWGQLPGGSPTDMAWPTLEFANFDGVPVAEVWDTFTGNIEGMVGVEYGDTISLEIAVNPYSNEIVYYLDGAEIFRSASEGYEPISHVIFNNLNDGVAGNDYATKWSNLSVGIAQAPVRNVTTGEGFLTINEAIADTDTVSGNVIEVNKNLTINEQQVISKAVTIDGNGFTLTGNYVRNGSNNSIITVTSDNVAIHDITVDGVNASTTFRLHGINIYQSDNVILSNITALNNQTGVVVNGSTVTINTIRTAGNSWHGINVDKLDSDGSVAHLTISGANVHEEAVTSNPATTAPAIYSDDLTKNPVVTDVDGQYVSQDNYKKAGDRAYWLKLATPTHVSPAASARINTNNFWFDWNDVPGAVSYEMQNSQSSAVAASGSFQNVQWTGDYQRIQPTESKAQSVGASGTWYWQVRAVDAAGNKSAWTAPWAVTIDMTAPGAPTLVTPDWYVANGATKTLDWNAPADTDVAYYQYAEYNFNAPTSDTTPWSWVKQVNAPNTITTDTAWQSDVKIYWRVRAVDTAGNVGPWSETRLIVSDRTKPTTTHDLPDVITGTTTIHQNVADNYAPASGKLRIWKLVDGTTTADNSKFYAIGDVAVDASGNIVYTLDPTKLFGTGSYIAKFTATDRAGNAIVVQKYFTLDAEAPIVTLDEASLAGATPLLTGTVNDPDAAVVLTIDGEPFTAQNNGDGTWEYQVVTPLTEGTHPITVVATDEHGNASNAQLGILEYTAPVEEDDGEEVVILTPTAPSNSSTTGGTTTVSNVAVLPAATFGFAAGVLGTTDSTVDETDGEATDTDDAEVEGISTESTLAQALDTENTDGEALGLSWYWWLLILAGAGLVSWAIVAMIRRNGGDE